MRGLRELRCGEAGINWKDERECDEKEGGRAMPQTENKPPN